MVAQYNTHILRAILLTLFTVTSGHPVMKQLAAIEAVPPNVSISPMIIRNGGNFINIDPLLTNSLLQALADESDHKKRVQRYRDVA